MSSIRRSLVIPVYNNADSIPELLDRIESLAGKIGGLEAILVVDGSPDESFALLAERLPARPFPSQLLMHSRNFGAFSAVRSGLEAARGSHVAVMAADLQEPEELIVGFFETLDSGEFDVVLGERLDRRDPLVTRVLSGLYWRLYRRFVQREMPSRGVDVFAINRAVLDSILSLDESSTSLVSQVLWVGFRRTTVPYERLERRIGKSSWTFGARARYAVDGFVSFSDIPILGLVWIGFLGLLFSAGLGIAVAINRMLGLISQPGYATTVLAILFLSSLMLASQGILGMYVWRAYENAKGRPSGIVAVSEAWNGTPAGARTAIDAGTPSSGHLPGGCRIETLDQVSDDRGVLSVVEFDDIAFRPERAFFIGSVPAGIERGGHAHRTASQLLVAAAGAVTVTVFDGISSATVELDRPDVGLLVPALVWATQSFTGDAVLIVLASEPFREEEYIRGFAEFVELAGAWIRGRDRNSGRRSSSEGCR